MLLHIAIVQHQEASVLWLLDNGAFLTARARGLFFQPRSPLPRPPLLSPCTIPRGRCRVQDADPDVPSSLRRPGSSRSSTSRNRAGTCATSASTSACR
eukprot:1676485-Rhodomonas_salina.1